MKRCGVVGRLAVAVVLCLGVERALSAWHWPQRQEGQP